MPHERIVHAQIVRCSTDFVLFAAPPLSGSTCRRAYSGEQQVARGSAAPWLFSSRRRALILLGHVTDFIALPNVELTGLLRQAA